MADIVYYAAVRDGRRIAEVRVTRSGGRQVSQVPTGVVYRSDREAQAALAAKNLEISRERYG